MLITTNSFIFTIVILTDFFDETAAGLSPRDVIKEASDVLSLLSGHEGGIKPSVLTSRTKYSDEDSKSASSQGSRERPARFTYDIFEVYSQIGFQ